MQCVRYFKSYSQCSMKYSRIGKKRVSKSRGGEILVLEVSFYLVDLLRQGFDLLRADQGAEFLVAAAIAFACIGLSVPHRHPGAQRAEEWFDCRTRRKKFGS